MIRNVELNYKRLLDKEYRIENLFQNNDNYDWPGDWEGRALLAFTCHYEMTGNMTPALKSFKEELKKHYNDSKYLGKEYDQKTVDEQQLSGHSWYLRGILKYYELFNDLEMLEIAKETVYNLYLPIMDKYNIYPLYRNLDGGVSGHSGDVINGWKVSSDVGCAFMCVDGLSHFYKITKDENVKRFLDKAIEKFMSIDIVENKFQTHTSLSCARGILNMYLSTNDDKYLGYATNIFDIYLKYGMTLTYENYNWFKRTDTWTEPCCIVDSFILATELYKITKDNKYLTLSRRIWFNGLQFAQRINGGAGPNNCVTRQNRILKIFMYEAAFCCTMRYAEGLLEYMKNENLFKWNSESEMIIEDDGRRYIDDKLVVKYGGKEIPIFSCNDKELEEALKMELEIIY